jgi:CrcB protein
MFDFRTVAVVGVGAAIGGIARLVLTQLVLARAGPGAGPYATLFINVSGSFAIGIVIAVAGSRPEIHPLWRYFLATGILGGYTTFSTFSLEAFNLASGGLAWLSAAYVAASVGLGIGGAALGAVVVRSFNGAP